MNQSNTALLVIDIINSCAHEKCEIPEWGISFFKIRAMIPKLKDFIADYRKSFGGLVIFANTTPWQKEYLTDNINELYTDPKACYYSKDDSGFAEEFYLVSPEAQDVVITKNHYDVFTNKKLQGLAKEKRIRYFIITGIFGDGCVMASICGGFSQGFNFVILEDLIETTDVKIRQRLLQSLKEFTWPFMYGKTMDSKKFLSQYPKQRQIF
ncbi:MAG: isochorismatase family protein [bacterium]